MAQLTPDLAKERMHKTRRIDLPSGDHVYIVSPTAGDVLKLSDLPESDRVLYLLSRILCYEDGSLFYPNGSGMEEIALWPAETITEIASIDLVDLDQAAIKKN